MKKELTKEHVEFLKKHYNRDMSPSEISEKFGMSVCTLQKRIKELGLRDLIPPV